MKAPGVTACCYTHSQRLFEYEFGEREAEIMIPQRIDSTRLSSTVISDFYASCLHDSSLLSPLFGFPEKK